MKKIFLTSLSLLTLGSIEAAYQVSIPLERHAVSFLDWVNHTPDTSEWVNVGGLYGCSNWSPLTTDITINQNFTQSATDCSQNQERFVQEMEIDTKTGQTRKKGEPYQETKTLVANDSRNAIGTKETWVAIAADYSLWINNGAINSCSNWLPATASKPLNQAFTQTATNCLQPQMRTRQNLEQEMTTGAIRNNGDVVTETQNIAASSTRTAYGTAPAPQPTGCFYDSTHSMTYTAPNNVVTIQVRWGSSTPIGTMKTLTSSFHSNGYRYYTGTHQGGSLYQVCRVLI